MLSGVERILFGRWSTIQMLKLPGGREAPFFVKDFILSYWEKCIFADDGDESGVEWRWSSIKVENQQIVTNVKVLPDGKLPWSRTSYADAGQW